MSLFSSFPFVRILFPFLAGIILAIYIHVDSPVWLAAVLLCFIFILAETFFFNISSVFRLRYLSGALYVLGFFSLGTFLVQHNNQRYYVDHFSKTRCNCYYAEISEAPIEKKSSYKLVVQVKQAKCNGNWKPVKGKLLCYVKKNEPGIPEAYFPQQGDCFIFSSRISEIESAKNPGQFDYKQYLYYHNIYQQTFIKPHELQFVKREGNWLRNFAFDLRKKLIRSFKNCGLRGNELAVASALLFGVTDNLDPALMRSYAGTGALHVLSVSGLHVAILYGFLQLVLSFLKSRKNGNVMLGIIILIFIWFYALLTGLTPSVLRSSTMFTFIVIGQIISRQSSVYNSLAASAFVLLCYDPFLIMEVGFQLSYLAVTGIIVLYPIINRQLTVNLRYLKPVWDITSVSLAAQIATLPLGFLYFHQFPNYFVFSNLLVIPLSGFILYAGIIASFCYLLPFVQFMLVCFLEWLIYLLNSIVDFIEKLPYALLEGISITILESCLLYLVILAWLVWYKTSKPVYIKWMLGFAVVICIFQVIEAFYQQKQEKIIVYHVAGHIAVDFIRGNEHVFLTDSSFYNDPDKLLFNVRHNWDDMNLNQPEVVYHTAYRKLNSITRINKNLAFFGNKSVQIIDSSYNYKTDSLLKTDFILLTQNAKINLEKSKNVGPKTILIADGSNKFYKIEKWQMQAKAKNLKFYSTSANGAFIVNLE
ncbi:MAG TPA: ComEC/Rec2 family competence protein [Flavobacteriales bacterium]|nr:ComEC/Rec2 family competence protein [Flavobacteriales bacterium]